MNGSILGGNPGATISSEVGPSQGRCEIHLTADVAGRGYRVPLSVMFTTLTRRQLIFDVAAAAVLWLLTLVPSVLYVANTGDANGARTEWIAIGISVVMAAALAVRRLSPALSLAIAWIGAIAQMLCGLSPIAMNLAIFGVLYATAAYGSPRVRKAGFISVFVGATVVAAYLVGGAYLTNGNGTGTGAPLNTVIPIAFFIIVTWAATAFGLGLSYTLGTLKRTRLAAVETERQASVAAALAASEQERTRIARDMHDVVAHSLAVVIAQADGARYAAATQPEVAAEALTTISQTARSALADVRLLLTQLRHSQAEGPQPTLADLEELYAQVRGAGVELLIDVDPAPRSDPPAAVQLAIYRIMQEALTNAIRHGDGTPVDVSLSFAAHQVTVRVRNTIAADDVANPGGHGLIGMRERATLVAGTLETVRTGSDFVVRAVIPLPEVVSVTEPSEQERA